MSTTDRQTLEHTIAAHRDEIQPVVAPELFQKAPAILNLSESNTELAVAGDRLMSALDEYVESQLAKNGVPLAIGKYDEDRVIYRHSDLFDREAEPRSIHLGIDLFAAAGTPVHSPLGATVHSLGFNDDLGDYGPTLVLRHDLEGVEFFTLYGHLAYASVANLRLGQPLAAGTSIAAMGRHHENGGWSPHLHFQLIRDMGDWEGNYPGVAAPSGRQKWLDLCPDPTVLLGMVSSEE